MRKVESLCWKQGQTNGKNNFEHILSLQGAKYVLGSVPIYTCIPKQSKIQAEACSSQCSGTKQSSHTGPGCLEGFCLLQQTFQGWADSSPSMKCGSEALVLSVNATVFGPQRQERCLLSPQWHIGSSNTPPLYIFSQKIVVIAVRSSSFMVMSKTSPRSCKEGLFCMQNARD